MRRKTIYILNDPTFNFNAYVASITQSISNGCTGIKINKFTIQPESTQLPQADFVFQFQQMLVFWSGLARILT